MSAAYQHTAAKPASIPKSSDAMLAEVAADAGLQEKLISAKHGSVDAAVSDRYAVTQGQRAHQPLPPATAADSSAAERARLLAEAAARADAKTATEQHAAALIAGKKADKRERKASKTITAPEQKAAVQAEVKGEVAACKARQEAAAGPADAAAGDATATAPAAESRTQTEAEAQAAADLKTAQAQAPKEPAAATKAQAKASKKAQAKAAKAAAKHAQAANAKAAVEAKTKAPTSEGGKATLQDEAGGGKQAAAEGKAEVTASAGEGKAAGAGQVAQVRAEAAPSSATPKLPTTDKKTIQGREGAQQGSTTSQQTPPGNPYKPAKPQKGGSLEQKPVAATATCSQQQPAGAPATQAQTITNAKAAPATAAKARAGQAATAKAKPLRPQQPSCRQPRPKQPRPQQPRSPSRQQLSLQTQSELMLKSQQRLYHTPGQQSRY